MKFIIIRITNPNKEYELIREELAQYNILPVKMSENWNFFEYLGYNLDENTITNYSSIVLACNHILCESVNEFIEEVKKELNIEEMKKSFTLNDLKPGMVVEYRNGDRRLVVSINDKLYFISDTTYLEGSSDNYSIDLTCPGFTCFDIMKIYKVNSVRGLLYMLSSARQELIWERKEPRAYTMQEIANKLGIPVEQLRIKE